MNDIPYRLYIGLGGNINDPIANIKKAIFLLQKESLIEVESVSSLWKTSPVGYEDQPAFFNAVISVIAKANPQEIQEITQAIERKLQKKTPFLNGPRTIDIDLLYIKYQIIETNTLIIPHPRMLERLFVLLPLKEVVSTLGKDEEEFFRKVDLYGTIDLLQKREFSQNALLYIDRTQRRWWDSL